MALIHTFSIQRTDARHNVTRGNRNTSTYQQDNDKDRTHSASPEQQDVEFLFFTQHCDARTWRSLVLSLSRSKVIPSLRPLPPAERLFWRSNQTCGRAGKLSQVNLVDLEFSCFELVWTCLNTHSFLVLSRVFRSLLIFVILYSVLG